MLPFPIINSYDHKYPYFVSNFRKALSRRTTEKGVSKGNQKACELYTKLRLKSMLFRIKKPNIDELTQCFFPLCLKFWKLTASLATLIWSEEGQGSQVPSMAYSWGVLSTASCSWISILSYCLEWISLPLKVGFLCSCLIYPPSSQI